MPVQAFSIFIFSCHPERNIDVRIDQLLYQKYGRAPNTRENIHVGRRLKLQFLYDLEFNVVVHFMILVFAKIYNQLIIYVLIFAKLFRHKRDK